jgi:hypothetical protein
MIRAEIEANNAQAEKLADENHAKVAQNVATGVVGVVIWPVWFAMDAKGAAGTEMDALKAPAISCFAGGAAMCAIAGNTAAVTSAVSKFAASDASVQTRRGGRY